MLFKNIQKRTETSTMPTCKSCWKRIFRRTINVYNISCQLKALTLQSKDMKADAKLKFHLGSTNAVGYSD